MPGVQQSSPQEITILHKNQQNWNSEKISFVQWWIRKKLIFFTIQKNWSFQLTVISCFEFYKQNYVNQKVNFYMRRRISTRGCVRPSVRPSVAPLVGPLRLFKNALRAHLMASIGSCYLDFHISSSMPARRIQWKPLKWLIECAERYSMIFLKCPKR